MKNNIRQHIEIYRKGLQNWAREMYKLSPEGTIDLLTALSKLNEDSQMMRMADQLLYVYSYKYMRGE